MDRKRESRTEGSEKAVSSEHRINRFSQKGLLANKVSNSGHIVLSAGGVERTRTKHRVFN